MSETEQEAAPLALAAAPKTAVQFPFKLVIGKSLLATIVLGGAIVATTILTTGTDFLRYFRPADNVSESQRQTRLLEFAALSPVRLSLVSDHDIAAALDSMQLSPPAKRALLSDIAPPAAVPATSASQALPAARPIAVQSQPVATPLKSAPLQLAWITLWDTDVEDGDVVRIDSHGYSRTVTLTTKPQTFAIPVPVDGVIRVSGILDGEGGGITVGLASGAAQAVFPVMSVGQVLGLKVKVD